MKPDPVLKSCAKALIRPNKSPEEISEQVQDLINNFFGRKSNDTLSSLRNIIFTMKVATAKAFVTPERLPHTSPVTRHHSLSTSCQVMAWMPMDITNEMSATKWGWKEEKDLKGFNWWRTRTLLLINFLKVSIVIVQQDAHLPIAAADTLDSPALRHVALVKLKTGNPNNNQESVEEGDIDH